MKTEVAAAAGESKARMNSLWRSRRKYSIASNAIESKRSHFAMFRVVPCGSAGQSIRMTRDAGRAVSRLGAAPGASRSDVHAEFDMPDLASAAVAFSTIAKGRIATFNRWGEIIGVSPRWLFIPTERCPDKV
jgi:hypothetical protein